MKLEDKITAYIDHKINELLMKFNFKRLKKQLIGDYLVHSLREFNKKGDVNLFEYISFSVDAASQYKNKDDNTIVKFDGLIFDDFNNNNKIIGYYFAAYNLPKRTITIQINLDDSAKFYLMLRI